MKPSRLLFAAALSALAACSSLSHQLVPLPAQDVPLSRPDLTRIYIVRDDAFGLQNRDIKVLEQDKEIGSLTRGTYLCWERPGGRTLARAFYGTLDPGRSENEGLGDLDCDAGHVYWFNVTLERDTSKPVFTPLSEKDGKRLVAERKPAAD